jgi:hypothetical protein
MTQAARAHDHIAAARKNYHARGWFSEEGDSNCLGRFTVEATKTQLPGQEPKTIHRIVLHAFSLSSQNLAEPDISATPMKPTNRVDLIARFPEAWTSFLGANPDAPVPGDPPPRAKTPEEELGPMPTTRTRIPWPGFTDDITYGQLLNLNIDTLEVLAYATDTQVWHIGPEGQALRQKARDSLGLSPRDNFVAP